MKIEEGVTYEPNEVLILEKPIKMKTFLNITLVGDADTLQVTGDK